MPLALLWGVCPMLREEDQPCRHNTLHHVVYNTFQQAGLSAHLEDGCGMGTRSFQNTKIQQIYMLEAGVSAKAAERRKHTENDPDLGWRWIGELSLVDQRQLAFIRGNTPKSKV